jgi:hypothetical protein
MVGQNTFAVLLEGGGMCEIKIADRSDGQRTLLEGLIGWRLNFAKA